MTDEGQESRSTGADDEKIEQRNLDHAVGSARLPVGVHVE